MTHNLKGACSGQAQVIESPLLDPRIFGHALEGRPVLRSTVLLDRNCKVGVQSRNTLALMLLYNKTDNSHSIYAAATLLHPSYRKQYYDDTWTGDSIDWKDQMLAKVKAVWEQQYKAQAPTQEQQQKAKPPSFIQKYVQKKVQIQASEDLFKVHPRTPKNTLERKRGKVLRPPADNSR
jgi:hypothetical protein